MGTQQNIVATNWSFQPGDAYGPPNVYFPNASPNPPTCSGANAVWTVTPADFSAWNKSVTPNILIVGIDVTARTENPIQYGTFFTGISNGLGGDDFYVIQSMDGDRAKNVCRFYPPDTGFVMHSAQRADGTYDHIDTYMSTNGDPTSWYEIDVVIYWVPYTGP